MAHDILIVDDEQDIRDLIAGILNDDGYKNTRVASDGFTAMKMIKNLQPNLVILDVWLGNGEKEGLRILETIKRDHPFVPVIMISGHSTIETAVHAIKIGAHNFIEKPFNSEQLLLAVKLAIESARLKIENQELKVKAAISAEFIGNSQSVNHVRNLITEAAKNNNKVLITGQVGVGKETIAREIHKLSNRKNGPFIVMNFANLSPNLVEAELFGTEINNQHPNTPRKIGLLECANGGTIYLEEILSIPLSLQSKMINFLQNGFFHRVGSNEPLYSDVRIISSTSKKFNAILETDKFNKNLFYRLNTIHINVPPLKERGSDIPLLLNHFMQQLAAAKGMLPKKFTDDAVALLQAYSWPGNVRQLRNTIEWLLIMVDSNPLEPISGSMLPAEITSNSVCTKSIKNNSADIVIMPLREAREAFEREYLLAQMQRFEGNVSKTADFIGMERSALHRKLKLLGVVASDR